MINIYSILKMVMLQYKNCHLKANRKMRSKHSGHRSPSLYPLIGGYRRRCLRNALRMCQEILLFAKEKKNQKEKIGL